MLAQLVERQIPNLKVKSSILLRLIFCWCIARGACSRIVFTFVYGDIVFRIDLNKCILLRCVRVVVLLRIEFVILLKTLFFWLNKIHLSNHPRTIPTSDLYLKQPI